MTGRGNQERPCFFPQTQWAIFLGVQQTPHHFSNLIYDSITLLQPLGLGWLRGTGSPRVLVNPKALLKISGHIQKLVQYWHWVSCELREAPVPYQFVFLFSDCYRQNVYVPLKFLCWDPNSQLMVLEEGGFDSWLDYEGGTLMSGISALLKRPKKAP